ncbi:MAG: NAD(P)H-dependent oxidoreductase [Solirubrobacteraceae bacterium]
MAHLLHVDSSITGDYSVTRALTARAVDAWKQANPGGTVTYRDLAASPVPHLDAAGGLARAVPPADHTPAQAASYAISVELIDEVKAADTVILGLPLYNFGAPSTVKSWVDHLIAPGLSYDPESGAGLFGDTDFIVLASRGGGYGEGTPRYGWEHAATWLPHGLSLTGLEPRFIAAELTLAKTVPAMNELIPLAEESLAAAEAEIDELFTPATV